MCLYMSKLCEIPHPENPLDIFKIDCAIEVGKKVHTSQNTVNLCFRDNLYLIFAVHADGFEINESWNIL